MEISLRAAQTFCTQLVLGENQPIVVTVVSSWFNRVAYDSQDYCNDTTSTTFKETAMTIIDAGVASHH